MAPLAEDAAAEQPDSPGRASHRARFSTALSSIGSHNPSARHTRASVRHPDEGGEHNADIGDSDHPNQVYTNEL